VRNKEKALALLIVVLHFAVFILFIEFAFYGLFWNIFQRVNYEKRKQTAMDLMEIGQVYAANIEKAGLEGLKIDKEGKRRVYKSPSLIKDGYFTLEYDYINGSPVQVISTGYFEGFKYSGPIK
jgi:hypothetical protein